MILRTQARTVARAIGPVIITGIYFEMLSEEEKLAVIAHEKGHQAHMHWLKALWFLLNVDLMLSIDEVSKLVSERSKKHELEADAFATLTGHGKGLLKFLDRLKNHFDPLKDTSLHPSHDIRTGHIMMLMEDMAYSRRVVDGK